MADENSKGKGSVWTHLAAGGVGFALGATVGWMANDMDRAAQGNQAAQPKAAAAATGK